MAIRIFPCSLLRKDITITSREYGAVTKNEQEERKLQETIQGIQQLQKFKKKLIARDIASMSHRLQVILNKASAKKNYSNVLFTPEELREIQKDENRERKRKHKTKSAPCQRVRDQEIARKTSFQSVSSSILPRAARKFSSETCVQVYRNNEDDLQEENEINNTMESKLTVRRVSRYSENNKDGVHMNTRRINTWIEDATESCTSSPVQVDLKPPTYFMHPKTVTLKENNNDLFERKQNNFIQTTIMKETSEHKLSGKRQIEIEQDINLPNNLSADKDLYNGGSAVPEQSKTSTCDGRNFVTEEANVNKMKTKITTIRVSPVVNSIAEDDDGGHFKIPQIVCDEPEIDEKKNVLYSETVVGSDHYVSLQNNNNSDKRKEKQSMFASIDHDYSKATKLDNPNKRVITEKYFEGNQKEGKELKLSKAKLQDCPTQEDRLPVKSNDRRMSVSKPIIYQQKGTEKVEDTESDEQQCDENKKTKLSFKGSKCHKNIKKNRWHNVNKRQEEVSRRLMIGVPTLPLNGNSRFTRSNEDTVNESNADNSVRTQLIRKESKKMTKRLTLLNNLLGSNLRVDGGGSTTTNEGLTSTTQTDMPGSLAPLPSVMNKILLQRRKTVIADEIVIPGGWEIQRCSELFRGNQDLDTESMQSTELGQEIDIYEDLKKCRYLRLPSYLNVD